MDEISENSENPALPAGRSDNQQAGQSVGQIDQKQASDASETPIRSDTSGTPSNSESSGKRSLPIRRMLVIGIVILIIMNLGILYQRTAISPENLSSIKSEKDQEEVITNIVNSLSSNKDKEALAHLNLAASLDDPKQAYQEYKLAYTTLGLRFNETNDDRYKQIMNEVKIRMQSFAMYRETDVIAPKKRGIKKAVLVEPETGKEYLVPQAGYLDLGLENKDKAQTYLVRLEYTDGKKEESFVTFENKSK